jgi:molybdopterin synthase sulfur carrier subunit
MTRLVYFAWVRERIGKGEEDLALPSSVVTVFDLLSHLKTLGEEYEMALQYPDVIRVALDQEHVEHDEPIGGAREIGIFPPMTGG